MSSSYPRVNMYVLKRTISKYRASTIFLRKFGSHAKSLMMRTPFMASLTTDMRSSRLCVRREPKKKKTAGGGTRRFFRFAEKNQTAALCT